MFKIIKIYLLFLLDNNFEELKHIFLFSINFNFLKFYENINKIKRMFRSIPVSNKICFDKQLKRNWKIHERKLNEMKSKLSK